MQREIRDGSFFFLFFRSSSINPPSRRRRGIIGFSRALLTARAANTVGAALFTANTSAGSMTFFFFHPVRKILFFPHPMANFELFNVKKKRKTFSRSFQKIVLARASVSNEHFLKTLVAPASGEGEKKFVFVTFRECTCK